MALADPGFEHDGAPEPPALSAAEREFAHAIRLHKQGELDDALRSYARVLDLDPLHRDALNNIGVVLRAKGRHLAALAAYERALTLQPDDPGLLGNIGNALRATGQLERALSVLYKAVSLAPQAPAMHHNLGLVLRDLGHYDEALACFDRSLTLWPNNARVRLDRALTLLAKGDYRAGFEGLEARREVWDERLDQRLPIWTGGEVAGKSILLQAERSTEDTIQFVRFAPQVRARGARVVVACPAELRRLMASAEGVDEAVAFGQEPAGIELRLPMLSLPKALGTTLQSLPSRPGYVSAPEDSGFELKHPETAKLAVGMVWADRPTAAGDAPGGPGLADFMPLLARADIAFYSLQTGARGADLQELGAAGLIHDLSRLLNNIDDLARLIDQLDLIVTVNTTVAQLAGALGRPVWLVLPAVTDWRWVLERESSPWYPTMRLFRQPSAGDWRGAFEVVARKLHALVAA